MTNNQTLHPTKTPEISPVGDPTGGLLQVELPNTSGSLTDFNKPHTLQTSNELPTRVETNAPAPQAPIVNIESFFGIKEDHRPLEPQKLHEQREKFLAQGLGESSAKKAA